MMRPLTRSIILTVLVGLACGTQTYGVVAGQPTIELHRAVVDTAELSFLSSSGFEVTVVGEAALGAAGDDRYEVELLLGPAARRWLSRTAPDIRLDVPRSAAGLTFSQRARLQQQAGYDVYRPWDGSEGLAEEIAAIASDHPGLVRKDVIGHSVEGREIVALKVTKDASDTPDGSRPAALFIATQHAREWLATEMCRRLVHHFVDGYGVDQEITQLVDTTELWFVPVANPDGYQYTHDVDRGWRKNLRDNDGDGEITATDGVDPNRNFPTHWGYDNDGSSELLFTDTYRGPAPASEPETQAMVRFLQDHQFNLMLNYHTAAELLLYPVGWQDQTRAADDPIAVALAGTFDNPAVPGYIPIPSASLYITNGETCDFAATVDTLCFTPELTIARCENCTRFEFPDDEDMIEAEFQRNLPFAMDVARSTLDPAHPVSHLGLIVEPIYVDEFHVSYGEPQPVQATVARHLGDVTMQYRVNEGVERAVRAEEWDGGERYGEYGDTFYRRVRAEVSGTEPGDSVEVWFEAGGEQSEPFTYSVADTVGTSVLLVAAEDYTGITPEYEPTSGPRYLNVYLDALAHNEIAADVYDIDAEGRRAPSPLGVLSHYEVVIWYTGDDIITREQGMVPGTVSRLARDVMVAMRDYMNEGGRVVYIGSYAGFQFYDETYEFDPDENLPCDPRSSSDGCIGLKYDFLRWYMGADTYEDDHGTSPDGALYPVLGTTEPFSGMRFEFEPPPQGLRAHSGAFRPTSVRHPTEQFPLFASEEAARYDRPNEKPHTGDFVVYSGETYYSYQRLARTTDLTDVVSPTLTFWIARETRQPFDAVFVEAHTPGQDDWTTLPDLNGHTTADSALSCWSPDWYELFPQLTHYMTPEETGQGRYRCVPTGTTGSWNAATGNSGGVWEEWQVDLSPFAAGQVEVAITYLSSRVPYFGILIDDVSLSTGESTSFEEDLGGWVVSGAPPGHDPNEMDFTRATAADLPLEPVGAIVVTEDAIIVGFGLEMLATDELRHETLGRALDHLLPQEPPPPPTPTPTARYMIYLPQALDESS